MHTFSHISAKKPTDIINNNTSCWTDILHINEDHDYLENINYTTEFSINVFVYIAGFIVHKIQKKLRCFVCLKVLITTQSETTYHALIKIKSREYLIHPSADVVFICRSAEKVITSRFNNGDIIKSKLQKVIENKIIQDFVGRDIFSELNNYTKNQEPMQNHKFYLIKLIVETYVKTRMCHLLKLSTTKPSERQFYNKLTLFKEQ